MVGAFSEFCTMTDSVPPQSAVIGERCEPEPESPITRESLASGALRKRFVEASGSTAHLLSEAERNARFEAVLERVPPGEDLWVFAYGSMLWNPTVHYVEARTVTVHGWHRSFCLGSHVGRGSHEHPGLMLGLEPGGTCQGLAYRLPAAAIRQELHLLWQREMLTGAYQAGWLSGVCSKDVEISLVAFVIDPCAGNYEGGLPDEVQIQRIRHAHGYLGSNRDYLLKTRSHLRSLGVCDDYIERLALAAEQDLSNSPPSAL